MKTTLGVNTSVFWRHFISTSLWKIVTSGFISQWRVFSFLTSQWPQPLHSSTNPSAASLPFLNEYQQEPWDLLLNYTFLTCKKAEFHRWISRKLSNTRLCVLRTSSHIVSTDICDWQQICWYTLGNGMFRLFQWEILLSFGLVLKSAIFFCLRNHLFVSLFSSLETQDSAGTCSVSRAVFKLKEICKTKFPPDLLEEIFSLNDHAWKLHFVCFLLYS